MLAATLEAAALAAVAVASEFKFQILTGSNTNSLLRGEHQLISSGFDMVEVQ